MTEPIYDPMYWKNRLKVAEEREQLHHAIFLTGQASWEAIAERHKKILKEHIGEHDSILDAGCAWGRLLSLLPETWKGKYLGVDISPDFIELAKYQNPQREFIVGDMRHLPIIVTPNVELPCYDWAILVSIRAMTVNNVSEEGWEIVLNELKRVCKKVLILEYVTDDVGEIL